MWSTQGATAGAHTQPGHAGRRATPLWMCYINTQINSSSLSIHEEGAVKLPQYMGRVTGVGEGLWLCPPEPWGNYPIFPILRQIPAWLWGALSRWWGAGQGHQRSKTVPRDGGSPDHPSCTSPPRMNIHSQPDFGGVQGKAKVRGMGMGGTGIVRILEWRGSISQGCLQPSHPLSQLSGPVSRPPPTALSAPSFPEPFPNILQKPY